MLALSEINSVWAAELFAVPFLDLRIRTGYGRRRSPRTVVRSILPPANKSTRVKCSDAVWAAFCLAKMGNVENLPAIQ